MLTVYIEAATLFVSSSQTQVSVGETVRYRILLNTQSDAVNAVEGTIVFDPSMVEVVSVSSVNSVLGIWIEQPHFSNTAGTISFAGGVVSPGYTGSAGEMFSVIVRAKKEGSAGFKVRDVSIRENDGTGTDIYTGAGPNTQVNTLVIQKSVADVVPKRTVPLVVAKPATKPATSPLTQIITTKATSTLKDTIVQDDLRIILQDRLVEIGGIEDVDVAYVNISIDKASSTKILPIDGKIVYKLPELASGSYNIQAVLFDAVGNSFEIQDTIDISTQLTIAVLEQKESYIVGELIGIQGLSTIVDSFITVTVTSPDGIMQTYQTLTRADGTFEFDIAAEQEGTYTITGGISNIVTSDVLSLSIKLHPLQKGVLWVHEHKDILLSAVIALAVLLFAFMWIRRRKLHIKRYVPEMEKLEGDISKTLEVLKTDAENHLMQMDQIARFRNLTEEEKVLYMHCRSILK